MNFHAFHQEDKHTQEKEKPQNFEKIDRDQSHGYRVAATQGIYWLIDPKFLNTLNEQNKCRDQTHRNL